MNSPFVAFNFRVVISVDDEKQPLCECGFSAVDGLELSVENTTIREGGDNGRSVHLGGSLNMGTLTLKRGMSSSFDLWTWFEKVNTDGARHLRATIQVVMLGADRVTEQATFVLDRCLPTRLRIPGLDAMTGQLAVEELSVLYETVRLERPTATAGAPAGAANA